MKAKISIITLGVTDLETSLKFYRDGLGFKTHNYKEGENHVMFDMEGSWLSLFPKKELADDAQVPCDTNTFSGITLAHCVKTKEEVDQVIDFATKAGATLTKKPQEVFWGGYSGYFADPDGYLWEIAYNPFTDLS